MKYGWPMLLNWGNSGAGMPTIIDLVQELLEIVFEHLIAPYLGLFHKQGYWTNSVAHTVSQMQLV
jgi:hypothetical protein